MSMLLVKHFQEYEGCPFEIFLDRLDFCGFFFSLCQSCSVQMKQMENLQTEYKICQEALQRYAKTYM